MGLHSISLPDSVWFLYSVYDKEPVICIYPDSRRGSAYFEIGIFGRYFIRNLKLVDSIMPWIREEVKSKKNANI